jgi:hypothetical protein
MRDISQLGRYAAYAEKDAGLGRAIASGLRFAGRGAQALPGRAFRAVGGPAFGKAFNVAKDSFRRKPFTSLGKSVPSGSHQALRQRALQEGNRFLQGFNPKGFNVYAGRVKPPGSMLEHGAGVTDDLLGMRLRSTQGYGQSAVDDLVKQLTEAGVDVSGASRKYKPGYHGWNIKGTLPGGKTPAEFQLTPRRLQGLNQFDHMTAYKPQESGVMPWFGKNVLQPPVRYGMNVLSPFNSMRSRLALGSAPLGVAAAGILAGSGGQRGPREIAREYDNIGAQPGESPGMPPLEGFGFEQNPRASRGPGGQRIGAGE